MRGRGFLPRLAIYVDNRAKRPLFCAGALIFGLLPPEKGIADAT